MVFGLRRRAGLAECRLGPMVSRSARLSAGLHVLLTRDSGVTVGPVARSHHFCVIDGSSTGTILELGTVTLYSIGTGHRDTVQYWYWVP